MLRRLEHDPINVNFTTGTSGALEGKPGKLESTNHGGIVTIWGDTLVTSELESPGVEGCGVKGGADEAIDSALGLPSKTGNFAILNGVFKQTGSEIEREVIEGKL